MLDRERLQLARERLCQVQLALAYLYRRIDAQDYGLLGAAWVQTASAVANLEAALGQPVTPQGLFVEGGAM